MCSEDAHTARTEPLDPSERSALIELCEQLLREPLKRARRQKRPRASSLLELDEILADGEEFLVSPEEFEVLLRSLLTDVAAIETEDADTDATILPDFLNGQAFIRADAQPKYFLEEVQVRDFRPHGASDAS